MTQKLATAHNQKMFDGDVSKESNALLKTIRDSFNENEAVSDVHDNYNYAFNSEVSQVYITLLQSGLKPLRWGSRRKTLVDSLNRSIMKISNNARFQDFDINDQSQCRIMFEMVTSERPLNYDNVTINEIVDDRLEPGIDGLKILYKNSLYYYMPTDAVTHNIMSIRQAMNFICKRIGIAKETNSIRRRLKILANEPVQFSIINSIAFISYHDKFLPLYRGYPQPVASDNETLSLSMFRSVNWIIGNMKDNGQFLYYYDPILDTEIDFFSHHQLAHVSPHCS